MAGIVDDALVEADETVTVTLTGTDNGAVGVDATPATVTIADNDSALVSIAATADGDETGPVNGQFTVSMTSPSSTATTVSYTVTGSATAGSDYTALTGTLTIAAGATAASIDVAVLDDGLLENAETVVVTLDTITGGDADISIDTTADSATVSITDDDSATVTISDVVVNAHRQRVRRVQHRLYEWRHIRNGRHRLYGFQRRTQLRGHSWRNPDHHGLH